MSKIIAYNHIKTVQGDTFDGLALEFYDDEFKASLIMAANPDHCSTLIFEAGIEIRIPVLDGATTPATLPPWRQET